MEFLTTDIENDSTRNSIYSSIKDYSQDDLISLINKENTFFDNININELKLLNKIYFIKFQKIPLET